MQTILSRVFASYEGKRGTTHYVDVQNTKPLEMPRVFIFRKVLTEKSLLTETMPPSRVRITPYEAIILGQSIDGRAGMCLFLDAPSHLAVKILALSRFGGNRLEDLRSGYEMSTYPAML